MIQNMETTNWKLADANTTTSIITLNMNKLNNQIKWEKVSGCILKMLSIRNPKAWAVRKQKHGGRYHASSNNKKDRVAVFMLEKIDIRLWNTMRQRKMFHNNNDWLCRKYKYIHI
jgi:hypothetical protein